MEERVHCERCYEAGILKPAEMMYDIRKARADCSSGNAEIALPRPVRGRQYLCFEHFEILPPDFFDDYVPLESDRPMTLRFG